MPPVQVGDFRMNYIECGRGPETVLFVHGFTCCGLFWEEAMDRLPGSRYRTIAIDLRGTGDSDKPETGYSAVQYAEDIAGFVQQMGLRNFTIAGHSMGGTFVLLYALKHQELLKSIVLVNTGGIIRPSTPPPPPSEEAQRQQQNFRENALKDRNLMAGFYSRLFLRPLPSYVFDSLVDKAMTLSPHHLQKLPATMAEVNVQAQLGEIRVPTLVIGSDRDALVPPPVFAALQQAIPNASLHVFHRVGHTPQLEVPDDFVRVLTDFLDNSVAEA